MGAPKSAAARRGATSEAANITKNLAGERFCGAVRRVEDGLKAKGLFQELMAERAAMLKEQYECELEDGRKGFVLWNMRGKNACRALAVGGGGLASEHELMSDPHAVADRVCGEHEMPERAAAELEKIKPMCEAMAERLKDYGYTTTSSPLAGVSAEDVLYALTVIGLYDGTILKEWLSADCAYGLLRLATAGMGDVTRLTDEQREMGQVRGEPTMQASRESGVGLHSLLEVSHAFPDVRTAFRLYLVLETVGLGVWHVDVTNFTIWKWRDSELGPFVDKIWLLLSLGIGCTEEEVKQKQNSMVQGWVNASPLWCAFPVAIELHGHGLLFGTRDDVRVRAPALLPAMPRRIPLPLSHACRLSALLLTHAAVVPFVGARRAVYGEGEAATAAAGCHRLDGW
jgi:hypothetical protein